MMNTESMSQEIRAVHSWLSTYTGHRSQSDVGVAMRKKRRQSQGGSAGHRVSYAGYS